MRVFELLLLYSAISINGGTRIIDNELLESSDSRLSNKVLTHHKVIQYEYSDDESCNLPDRCEISLPPPVVSRKDFKTLFKNSLKNEVNYKNPYCMEVRKNDTFLARNWYKITDESSPYVTEFPFKDVPFLNQNYQDIYYATATNPVESSWLMLFQIWTTNLMSKAKEKIKRVFESINLHDIEVYRQLKVAFENEIRSFKIPQYFDKPSLHPETFTDPSVNQLWESNDIFSQRRLAGSCPFHLRKVTRSGDIGFPQNTLYDLLNKNYNIDDIISRVSEGHIKSMIQAINEGLLFILYHESYNDISTVPDILDKDPTDSRTLINVTSPITLFVLVNGELKVAAIQIDYQPSSPVYTPSSPKDKWLLARAMAELSDQDVCDAKVHLGYIHFHSTVFCLSFSRHLSKQHPLYEFFKWHCYGTVASISLSYSSLSATNRIYAIGHKGFLKLSKIGVDEAYYGQYELDQHLKRQGLDDLRIKYYPYRDDAKVINKELLDFSKKFVNLYYSKDDVVKTDGELQSFVNELSIDGQVKPDGGKGKVKFLPSKFTKKSELAKFLHQFLWFNVIHSVSNYAHSHSFIPARPTKLYNDTNFENSYPYNLPDFDVAVEAVKLSVSLDSFRANRLLDYSDKLRDKKFRELVYHKSCWLNNNVQKQLEQSNAKRKASGKLTFQYLEPKWLTNSIHI